MLHLPSISLDDPRNGRLFRNIVFLYIITGIISITVWYITGTGDMNDRDFLLFWRASQLIRQGHAELVYNLSIPSSLKYYYWRYPPLASLLYWPLSLLAWPWSWAVYTSVTGIWLIAIMHKIVDKPLIVWATLASPAVAFNTTLGQNGVLNAALMGFSLLYMERSPFASGLGAVGLACKPHLAPLLFFLELIHYRKTFMATMRILVSLTGLTIFLWGLSSWEVWYHAMTGINYFTISPDELPQLFNCMASTFFTARLLGLGITTSWIAQIAVSSLTVSIVFFLWRKDNVGFDIKAAATPIATFLISPYVFYYDYPILLPALAFWLRHIYRYGNLRGELHFIMVVWALPLCIGLPKVWHLLPILILLAALVFLYRRSSASSANIGVESTH